MSPTESWSCTSTLALDLLGRARRVLSVPCKSLLLSPCPQSWQLAGSWLLPSSAAPLGLQRCLTLSSPRAKARGFPWLQSHAGAHLQPWWGLGAGKQGGLSVLTPLPCPPNTGAVPAGSKPRSRWSLEAISGKDAVANSS